MNRLYLSVIVAFCLFVASIDATPPFGFTNSQNLNDNAATDDPGAEDRTPSLAADGSGLVIAVWSSQEDFGGTAGTDGDIAFSISTDDGGTWSSPAVLNSTATTDTEGDWDPTIATDGSTWMVVWRTDEAIGAIDNDPDIAYSVSTDDGVTWSPVAIVNDYADSDGLSLDDMPSVAVAGAGTFVCGWVSNYDFSGTHNLGTDYDPVYSIWEESGGNWTPVAPLATDLVTNTSSNEQHVKLASDGAGNVVATWASEDSAVHTGIGSDYDIFASRSSDYGATWSASVVVNSYAATDTSDEFESNIATDNAGNWVIVWSGADDLGGAVGTDYDIMYSISTNNGASWTPANTVDPAASTDGTSHDHQQANIAMRPNGSQWVVMWPSTNSLGGTIGTDQDIFISVSFDGGSTWSTGQPVEGVTKAGSDSSGSEIEVEVIISGGEDYIGVWSSSENDGGLTAFDFDLYVTKSAGLPVEVSAFSLD